MIVSMDRLTHGDRYGWSRDTVVQKLLAASALFGSMERRSGEASREKILSRALPLSRSFVSHDRKNASETPVSPGQLSHGNRTRL